MSQGSKAVYLAILFIILLTVTGFLFTDREPGAGSASLDPDTMALTGSVSDRFLSYNVEMVEVTGGRFWRPYKDGRREGDDRYEYRPPLDLSDPSLRKFAAALGPAYVRVSGTWANATFFDADNSSSGTPPQGFDTVLTGDQWRGVVDFARATDAQIVTSFATSPGARDEEGVWHPEFQADKLMRFTQDIGARIAAAEFANEPETVELTQAPEGYTPADYQRDYGRFHDWLSKASPSTKILAPGAAELGPITQFLRKWVSGYTVFDREDLISPGRHTPDAVSFHFYGAGSQRCGEMPLVGHVEDDALSGSWLGLVDHAIALTAKVRDRVAPDAPLWLTETGETACGGNPWASTFTDVFRFTDQLARSARQGVEVYMHNTLSASDYALLDEATHTARPNYWAAWLWKQLMGNRVLDAGGASGALHLYAHCQRNGDGVVVLAINRSTQHQAVIDTPAAGQLYSLSEGDTPTQALLNGSLLQLDSEGNLPTLIGQEIPAGQLELLPASVNFIVFPDADNAACQA